MGDLKIDGVPQRDLQMSLEKLSAFQKWAAEEKVDRWAVRAALLKALHESSEEYFQSENGTFREIAAFDNAVGAALETKENPKD
ncbi:MAG: hypothetical protein JRN52_08185 [Nitrososphaerota archaeon]|nr:hypothetical protein [Nitrososphaerota archaeon]